MDGSDSRQTDHGQKSVSPEAGRLASPATSLASVPNRGGALLTEDINGPRNLDRLISEIFDLGNDFIRPPPAG